MPLPDLLVNSINQVLVDYLVPSLIPLEVTPGEGDVAIEVFQRPLRPTDPVRSLGIYAAGIRPEDNHELGRVEPTTDIYDFRIQNMVKHVDEVRGRQIHGLDAKIIRAVLYRDPGFRVALTSLTEVLLGTRDRVARFGVRSQDLLRNEVRGQWLYVATTQFWVQTQSELA